jgi:hypothetical protein
MHPCTDLIGIQFFNISKVLDSMVLTDQTYNNTEVKNVASFTAFTQHLTHAVMKYEILNKVWFLDKSQQNYIKKLKSVWLRLFISNNGKVQHSSRHLSPTWVVLHFQHLQMLGSMIPKDQKKIMTLKLSKGQLCTAVTQQLGWCLSLKSIIARPGAALVLSYFYSEEDRNKGISTLKQHVITLWQLATETEKLPDNDNHDSVSNLVKLLTDIKLQMK